MFRRVGLQQAIGRDMGDDGDEIRERRAARDHEVQPVEPVEPNRGDEDVGPQRGDLPPGAGEADGGRHGVAGAGEQPHGAREHLEIGVDDQGRVRHAWLEFKLGTRCLHGQAYACSSRYDGV